MRQLISSGSPFEKSVGYSRAVVQGDWCFVAGTTGYDPVTREMPESAADQARNAFRVIEKALAEAGFALTDVVRAPYSFTDAAYWDEVGPVLGAAFGEILPAATATVVGLVKTELQVEREITAIRNP